MPILSDGEISNAVLMAGFQGEARVTAIAVALAESGGNSDATNKNSNGSIDYGLFQINSIHADLLNSHVWADPVENAQMALEISSNGTNWKPWVAYTTGRHIPYLPRAMAAEGSDSFTDGKTADPNDNPSIGDFFSMLLDGRTWIRLASIAVGFILILIGLSMFTDIDNKAAVGAVKLAIFRKVSK
jgi:hypothetical protein